MLRHFFHRRIHLQNYSFLQTLSLFDSSKSRPFCRRTHSVDVRDDVDDNGENSEPKSSLSCRVEELKRGESVVSAFQSWMGEGFPIHRGDIFHAINRLRKLKKNKRALEGGIFRPLLERKRSTSSKTSYNLSIAGKTPKSSKLKLGQVMEWVIRERPYKIKELDYSYLLEFTTKLHGVSHGESLFVRIPHEHQNELLYNNLVIACLDHGKIRLSLDYMRKMRELSFPISYHVYNRLIELHSSSGRKKSIPKILVQMKADGVSPHVSTYNILLDIEANNHCIEGLSKVFSEMKRSEVEPNEITYGILAKSHAAARLYTVAEMYTEAIERVKTGKNWSTFDILIILYGYLGKKHELERTWKLVKEFPHVRSKSFLSAIEAFGRISSLSRAEEIWAEMTSRGEMKSLKPFNAIISVYCRHGLVDKASDIFKEMEANGCKPNAITYRHLALGCLKRNLVNEALKSIEMGNNEALSFQVRRSTPWLEITHMLMEGFADIGDLDTVKKLFKEFKETRYDRNTFVHNTLLRAHAKAKVRDPDLLRRMILRGATPDAETYSLVRLIGEFKK